MFNERLCRQMGWVVEGRFSGKLRGTDGSVCKHVEAVWFRSRFAVGDGAIVEVPVVGSPLDLGVMSVSGGNRPTRGIPQGIIGCDVLSIVQPEGIETVWGPLRFRTNHGCDEDARGRQGLYMIYNIYSGDVEVRGRQSWCEFAEVLGSEEEGGEERRMVMNDVFSNMRTEANTGRREVTLPWKRGNKGNIGCNMGLAMGRFRNFVRQNPPRSPKFETLKKQIEQWKELGFVEDVPVGHKVEYVVPLGVVVTADGRKVTTKRAGFVRPGMKMKNRVVADFSAKNENSSSVNDGLYKGLGMLHKLESMIMEARLERYLVSADIEKAYLQVGIAVPDRGWLVYLWLKDPERGFCQGNIVMMWFKRCPFGLVCGGFLLATALCYWMLCSTTGVDDRGGGEDDNKWGNGEKTRGGGTIY
eukprot:GHVQ01011917.1.p1 GENE.GHVQ01011917.1~~GHVQ01011917.1.p1  ORF type:complete len:414 (+),score=39.61 GHVQ01011917.1:843-2084(+)